MLLLIILVLILVWGIGPFLHLGADLLGLVLLIALIGIVYTLYEGRRLP